MQKEKPTHPDQKYIAGLLNGDEKLIEKIYDKCFPQARRFILKNSGTLEDVKDIFQETIMYLLVRIRKEKFTLYAPICGYLYCIYRTKWINKLNKNGRNQVTVTDLTGYMDDSDLLSIIAGVNQSELGFNILKECFEKLSERCRDILNARYKDGLKGEVIKEKFNSPSVGAVRKAMHDCRERLKKCMEAHPDFKESNLN